MVLYCVLTAIAWLVLGRPVHILHGWCWGDLFSYCSFAVFCDDQSKFEQANILYIKIMSHKNEVH